MGRRPGEVMGWNSLGITHDFMARQVRPGELCIDATAGRGRDTLLLARLTGPTGRVIALDIQPEAVEATRSLLRAEGVSGWCEVHQLGHQELEKVAQPGTAGCIVFNLGWLPGGDHRIHTTARTTLPALEQALRLLRPGGALSLCVYYGKENGLEERDAVLRWLAGLDSRIWNVLRLDFPNRKTTRPFRFLFRGTGKRRAGTCCARLRSWDLFFGGANVSRLPGGGVPFWSARKEPKSGSREASLPLVGNVALKALWAFIASASLRNRPTP